MIAAAENPGGRGRFDGAAGAPRHSSPSIPVVGQYAPRLADSERYEIARLAGRIRESEPTLASIEAFGEGVAPGLGPWPALVIEDHSGIVLFEIQGDAIYNYRALLLAGEGDTVAIGAGRSPGFEAYCRDVLGLGRVEVVFPAATREIRPLAVRCGADERLLERLARQARRAGGFNLVPYMGTGGVWALAGKIAANCRCPVRVAAPPPRLVRRVNDKLWFAERVAQLLGRRALPPAHAVFGPAALAGRVASLARCHPSVAVKLPASASSAGNIVLDSDMLGGVSLGELRRNLLRMLGAIGWGGDYPLMVTAWERPIVSSPSAQVWIPRPEDGDPVVEGLFDQTLTGAVRAFSGAAPSQDPPAMRRRLAEEVAMLGCLFQELGYFGRASFDSILVGEDAANAEVHWVECNGRWGGVSIPMTLVNRLTGDWRRNPFVIFERNDLARTPRSVTEVLDALGDRLYRPGRSTEGVVLLSPGQIEAGTGFEAMALARTVEEARALADAAGPILS